MLREKYMNLNYLNSLPEEKNRFKVELENGEKVVFTVKNIGFGRENHNIICYQANFTVTNRRIITDTDNAVFAIDFADIVQYKYFEDGKGILANKGYEVILKEPMECGSSNSTVMIPAFIFVFTQKKIMARFREIAENVFI